MNRTRDCGQTGILGETCVTTVRDLVRRTGLGLDRTDGEDPLKDDRRRRSLVWGNIK